MSGKKEHVSATTDAVAWVFENSPPMGGATGEAFTNPLASSGMPPASVLAREAIQNSVDAREGDGKVGVDFVFRELVGKGKTDFVLTSGLSRVRDRSALLDLKQPNCLSSLEDPSVPLSLLFIDDVGTSGLAGDPTSPKSKFFRFLLSLGDGGKEHDEHGTGGSYGFGKSVYSSNSAVATIFAYSRTIDSSGEPQTLLFGCGYYRKHEIGAGDFTGRAWFGQNESQAGAHAPQIVRPLRNDEADDVAASLGFRPRPPGDLGTSVLLVDAAVAQADVLAGVEDWWWPRLLDHRLDVRVIGPDGTPVLPRPRKRADLRPFLDAYEIAIGKSPANNKSEFRRPLNKMEGIGIGSVGFKVLEKDENGAFPVEEARIDSVALIRSPLMVVAYHRAWNAGTPAMAGAFVADDEIDDILRAAEPPAHDRWDVGARRLQDQTGWKRNVVKRVLDNIRRNLASVQKTASPPPPQKPKRLSLLERTLATFLTPSKKGSKAPPEGAAAPIHIKHDKEPRAEAIGDKLRLVATFSVRLKADEIVDTASARVRVSCPVIEDGQEGDPIPINVTCSAPLSADASKPGWQIVEVGAKPLKFECVSEAYDPLWTVRFVPEVEAVGAS